ncbi:Hypothetical predicted protein [Olea europaea subsp. europaea]|uniref:Uncharacterized protein n=1 Tax=Olea europaea subsp. europaea TaxID=158383 RepID=A0A8S0TI81_OLEEU|nr:Hypothetical predicted protein [Olea europaea subsp. europaea]
MSTKEQHDKKEYVKPDMFFIRRLLEKKKMKPLGSGSSTYKNQRDELARLSKLNPTLPPEMKREGKGKEKVEPSEDERKMRTHFCPKSNGAERGGGGGGGAWEKQPSQHSITEGKASSFLGDRSDETASEVLEMLHTERKTSEAVADAQKLKNEVAAAEEALEASKLKHVELELVVEQLTSANRDLIVEVHLCQSEVKALMKQAENPDNLQKIASTALEEANKDKVDLKTKVEGLTAEAAGLK